MESTRQIQFNKTSKWNSCRLHFQISIYEKSFVDQMYTVQRAVLPIFHPHFSFIFLIPL